MSLPSFSPMMTGSAAASEGRTSTATPSRNGRMAFSFGTAQSTVRAAEAAAGGLAPEGRALAGVVDGSLTVDVTRDDVVPERGDAAARQSHAPDGAAIGVDLVPVTQV